MWDDLPYTVCLMLDGFMGAVNRWLLQCVCFLQFSVAQVVVELRKQFINYFVFPTWAWKADFNNNNNRPNVQLKIIKAYH